MTARRVLVSSFFVLIVCLLSSCVRPFTTPAGPTPTALSLVEKTAQEPASTQQTASSTPSAPTASPTEPAATVTAEPTRSVAATAEPSPQPSATATTEPSASPTATKSAKLAQSTQEPAVADATKPAETTTASPESTATPEVTAVASALVISPSPRPLTHTVQAGENLFRIGLAYNMSWADLAAANQLANANVIYVRQVLVIPDAQTRTLTLPATHQVQAGENLFRIGLLYGVAWQDIARANQIVNPARLVAGQVLEIPAASEPAPSLPSTYTVQPGDNLFRIGLYFDVPWEKIAAENHIIDPRYLPAGLQLVIPAAD